MKYKYEKESLEVAVKLSQSINEVFARLGAGSTGNAYKVFRKKIAEWNIDISHFLNASDLTRKMYREGRLQKLTNESIFTADSVVARNTVKNRLIETELIEYRCQKCGNTGEWLGEPLTLILDHINGVNNDHRLENLRFMCPNCNSGLKTHCRGAVEKRELIEETVDRRTLPQDRSKFRKCERPSYDVLISEIENHGHAATGRKYGVSDNAVRKWVKNYQKQNGLMV